MIEAVVLFQIENGKLALDDGVNAIFFGMINLSDLKPSAKIPLYPTPLPKFFFEDEPSCQLEIKSASKLFLKNSVASIIDSIGILSKIILSDGKISSCSFTLTIIPVSPRPPQVNSKILAF